MVIKMLKELWERMGEFYENFKKEIRSIKQ